MREILFRGKRTDGEWVEGSLLKVTLNGQTAHLIFGDNFILICDDVKSLSHALVDPATVGQFTGLIDKNGRKIFEGDILSSKIIEEDNGNVIFEKEVVIWHRNAWHTRTVGHGYLHQMDEKECLPISEVIGNIHDKLVEANG